MLGMARRGTLGMHSGVTRRGSDKVGTSWTAGLSAFSRAATGISRLTHTRGERGYRLPAQERTTMDDSKAVHDDSEAEATAAHDRSEAEYKAAHEKREAEYKAAHDRSEAEATAAHEKREAEYKATHDESAQAEDDESKKAWRRD
jgi:hypothetical protein